MLVWVCVYEREGYSRCVTKRERDGETQDVFHNFYLKTVFFVFSDKKAFFCQRECHEEVKKKFLYQNIEEIKDLVYQAVEKSGKKKLRIASHRDAKFEAVFRVLALCQVNEWSPVIAYENE